MQILANAKINLGLNVLKRRSDGFHELESIFLPIALYDEIEIKRAQRDCFTVSGVEIPPSDKGNLCLRAIDLLREDFELPFLKVHLHKKIPIGAGLGGGSADAAFILKGINSHFNLKLTNHELMTYAAKLGSDCIFFIENVPAMVRGRGERIDTDQQYRLLKGCHILLVKPNIFVSTKQAYQGINPKFPEKRIKEITRESMKSWRADLHNDFETAAFKTHPELKAIKNQLYGIGATYASMSGSGSCMYGVFETRRNSFDQLGKHWNCWTKVL